jgi:hypothetical protein
MSAENLWPASVMPRAVFEINADEFSLIPAAFRKILCAVSSDRPAFEHGQVLSCFGPAGSTPVTTVFALFLRNTLKFEKAIASSLMMLESSAASHRDFRCVAPD